MHLTFTETSSMSRYDIQNILRSCVLLLSVNRPLIFGNNLYRIIKLILLKI